MGGEPDANQLSGLVGGLLTPEEVEAMRGKSAAEMAKFVAAKNEKSPSA